MKKYSYLLIILCLSACQPTDTAQSVSSPPLILDDHGHGPDPGSAEAAAAITYQVVMNFAIYQEDGFALTITGMTPIAAPAPTYLVSYKFRHFGDLASFYTGTVRVIDDVAHPMPEADNIEDAQSILTNILQQVLPRSTGFNQHSVITGLLKTEHQHSQVYGLLQQRYNLSVATMDALWTELTQLATVGQWIDQLSVSNKLVDQQE